MLSYRPLPVSYYGEFISLFDMDKNLFSCIQGKKFLPVLYVNINTYFFCVHMIYKTQQYESNGR